MLYVVNHELFQFNTESGTNEYGTVHKTRVYPNIPTADDKEHRIMTIVSNSKNYNSNNMQLTSSKVEGGNVNVLLKSFDTNKYDMRLYLVALPFNGLAAHIPQSNLYRIHKGFLYTSKARNIQVGDSTYKKVLYLLVEPNVRMLDPENPKHVSSIDLVFDSYNIENVPGSEEKKTVQETITLTMRLSDDEPYTIKWDKQEVDPIDKETLKDIPLYTLYERKDKIPASPEDVAKIANKFNKSAQPNTTERSQRYKKVKNEQIEKLGYRTAANAKKSGNKGKGKKKK